MVNFFDFIGRVLISLVFLLSGYNKIFNYGSTISWMQGFNMPGFLLWPAIILEILLPLLIIVGYRTQIAAIIYLDFSNQMQTIAFLKNLGLAGGFLFIAINGTKDWAIEKKRKYVRL